MSEEIVEVKDELVPSLSKPSTLKAFSVELKSFIVSQNLYTPIQGKNYVNVEGWQFAGGSMGLVAVVDSCVKLDRPDEIAYESVVVVYSGEKIVSRGFAICSNKESKKKSFDEYAVASMSQTRAVGKAYRLLLGFLMKMAGYEGTPTEEMEQMAPRGTDIPSYCQDCGKEMEMVTRGPNKGQLKCKGKGGAPGTKPACPPTPLSESDQAIMDELNSIPNL